MATARNWLKTLFAASYKGVAFKIERDSERGSRRIVEHEFPNNDRPFLEDLGEGVRHFDVTAYVASDDADSEAAQLIATCAMRGPGTLVLPMNGPIVVRCLEFERSFEKDRMGYSAVTMKFSREGMSSALSTVQSLANMIYVRSEELTETVATTYANDVEVTDVPDYVATAAVDGIEFALSALETVRTTRAIDPVVSGIQRDVIATTFDQVEEIIASEDEEQLAALATTVTTIATELSGGMSADVAVAAFEEILTSVDAVVVGLAGSLWQPSVTHNRQVSTTLLRIAAMAAYCEAIERLTIVDRQSGITLRANVAEHFDAQLEAFAAEDYSDYVPIVNLRDAVVEYLSRKITTLVPSVTVSANDRMPSLYWAWRLYADPNRAMEIVSRNDVVHPSYIPREFIALKE
jgi:prophage DNA circulation protein